MTGGEQGADGSVFASAQRSTVRVDSTAPGPLPTIAGPVGKTPTAAHNLFGRDLIYVGLASLQLLLASVVSPVLTHLLTPHDFGLLATALALYQFLIVVGALGMDQVVVIVRSEPDNGPRRARRVMALSGIYALALGAVIYLSGPVWVHWLGLEHFSGAIAVAMLWVGPGAANLVALSFLRAGDRLLSFSIVSVLIGAGGQIVGIALCLAFDDSLLAYVWGGVITQCGALIVAIVLCRPSIPQRVGELLRALGSFRLGVPLAVNAMAMFLLNAGDRVILQRFLGSEAVARYQVAYIVGSVVMVVLSILMNTWRPRMLSVADPAERWAVIQRSMHQLQTIVAPAVLGIVFVSPLVLRLVAPAPFRTDALQLIVATVAVTAVPFADAASTLQELIALRRLHTVAAATVTAAVLNVVLNIWLVPTWRLEGSAVATLVSFTVQAGMARYLLRRGGHRWLISGGYAVAVVAALAALPVAVILPTTADWTALRVVAGLVFFAAAALRLRIVFTESRRADPRPRHRARKVTSDE